MDNINIVGKVEWVNETETSKGVIILEDGFYMFPCPFCLSLIKVKKDQLNCRIFRHGVYKNNGKGINPHLNEKKCKELVNKNLIYGCAGPFKFYGGGKKGGDCLVKKCGYNE